VLVTLAHTAKPAVEPAEVDLPFKVVDTDCPKKGLVKTGLRDIRFGKRPWSPREGCLMRTLFYFIFL
jgi:hypothetical protein